MFWLESLLVFSKIFRELKKVHELKCILHAVKLLCASKDRRASGFLMKKLDIALL